MKLAALAAPPPDYNHEEKGDALYSMEIALALEKLNFQMLYSLHDTAEKACDSQMADFVEEMMAEQVGTIPEFGNFPSCIVGGVFLRNTAVLAGNLQKVGVVDWIISRFEFPMHLV